MYTELNYSTNISCNTQYNRLLSSSSSHKYIDDSCREIIERIYFLCIILIAWRSVGVGMWKAYEFVYKPNGLNYSLKTKREIPVSSGEGSVERYIFIIVYNEISAILMCDTVTDFSPEKNCFLCYSINVFRGQWYQVQLDNNNHIIGEKQ